MYSAAVSFHWLRCSDLTVQCCHLAIIAVQDIRRTETDWGTHLIKGTASTDLDMQQKFARSICSDSIPHTEVNRKTDPLNIHTDKCTQQDPIHTHSLSKPSHFSMPVACVFYPYRHPGLNSDLSLFTQWETILLMRSENHPHMQSLFLVLSIVLGTLSLHQDKRSLFFPLSVLPLCLSSLSHFLFFSLPFTHTQRTPPKRCSEH